MELNLKDTFQLANSTVEFIKNSLKIKKIRRILNVYKIKL